MIDRFVALSAISPDGAESAKILDNDGGLRQRLAIYSKCKSTTAREDADLYAVRNPGEYAALN